MIDHEEQNVTNHAGRSQLVLDKAIDRVRKLLALSKGTSEHEAALAAGKAAALIEQFQLSEAMIRVDEPEAKPEPIEKNARLEPELPETRAGGRKRIAWKEAIAGATASDLGVKMYWRADVDIRGFGRESAIQTWRYTFQYLCRIVDEMADKGWERMGRWADSTARAWKNAFRVGCAQRISMRIYTARCERKSERQNETKAVHDRAEAPVGDKASIDAAIAAGRECQALAIVEKDQAEVDTEYKDYSKKWGRSQSSIGSTSSRDGYSAGQAAGDRVKIGGGGKGLPSGQSRLRGRS